VSLALIHAGVPFYMGITHYLPLTSSLTFPAIGG
jgi:hypothetical protein